MKLPKDEILTGNLGFRVYATLHARTESELRKKIEKYMREWPPQGYSTQYRKIFKHQNGYYYVHIRRSNTCD